MSLLTDKVAIITGGNSGIGLAAAEELIRQGSKVLITGRKKEAVEEAVKHLGEKAHGYVSDQSIVTNTEALVNEVSQRFGKIDILFINAGVATMAPFEHITEEQFDYNMDINFKGAFFTLQKFLPLLNEGASVIFLSSVNAFTGMPNTAVYGASKAALNSLARTAAYELAPKNIRVNTICPGPVNTPIFSKTGLPAEALGQFAEAMQQRIPMKRFGRPDEIAKLVAFLASDDSGFITGGEYVIDGGVNLNPILG